MSAKLLHGCGQKRSLGVITHVGVVRLGSLGVITHMGVVRMAIKSHYPEHNMVGVFGAILPGK